MQILSKKLEEATQQEEEKSQKPYDIFALPPPEFPLPQTKPKEVKKIPVTKIETEKIVPKEEKPKQTQVFKPKVKSEIESILDLDTKKLETAIILSEILSPPKALRR
jgi:hypothetical protein